LQVSTCSVFVTCVFYPLINLYNLSFEDPDPTNRDRHCGHGERELLEGIREGEEEEKEKCGGWGGQTEIAISSLRK